MVRAATHPTSQPGIRWYATKAGRRYRAALPGHPPKSGFPTIAAAKAWRAARLAEGRPVAGRAAAWTVADLAARWLVDLAAAGRVGGATLAAHGCRLQRHVLPVWGTRPARAVEPLDVQELYRAKEAAGMPAGTLWALHATVRALFGRAVALGVRPDNPAAGAWLPPRPASIGKAWSVAEVRRFLVATAEEDHWPLARVLVETGLRAGELVVLRWSDVDLADASLRVERTLRRDRDHKRVEGETAKTATSIRALALSAGCVAALREQAARQTRRRESNPLGALVPLCGARRQSSADDVSPPGGDDNTGFVFPGKHGAMWNEQTPRVWLQKRAAELGLPVPRLHDLRHTAATLGTRAGVDPATMARRLGHRIPGQTAVYTHLGAADQRAAAAAIGALIDGEKDPIQTPARRRARIASGKRPTKRAVTAKRGQSG